MAIIGTNRTGYALLRYDSSNMTAAQQRQYDRDCIQYLAARLQILEWALRKRGVDIRDLVEESQ